MSWQVLIADDDPFVRHLLASILKSCGANGLMVENGVQALAACQRQHFDLILLDIMMPELDGLAALARIRQLEHPNARTRIWMVTAHEGADLANRLAAFGADDYLEKPLDLALAKARLQTLMHTVR